MITLAINAEFLSSIALMVIAIVLSCIGIAGTILPAIPGTPFSFAALLIVFFLCPGSISLNLIISLAIISVIVMIIDYVAPVWLTKLGGGSKKAIWFSTAGLFIGFFFIPWGVIVGPFVGAFIGELIAGSAPAKALKVALWSLISFLLTSGAKLILGIVMAYYTLMPILSLAS